MRESAWEDANGPTVCYAALYTIWDGLVTHADTAATDGGRAQDAPHRPIPTR